ncbi:MAG: N-acetyltransferase [Alphaproteobacteria bacterium]|nr:N-acetyltransferase [Alphaproteobacteria bacterium]
MNAAPAHPHPSPLRAAQRHITIRAERSTDVPAREALLDLCFGPDRLLRSCQRLRDRRLPAAGLAFSAIKGGCLVGTLRLWHVNAGGRRALLLGPLAVDPACRNSGIGSALMEQALACARMRGHQAVILLGDAPYYARFGFSAVQTGALALPGPFAPERLLGLELIRGALNGASGMVIATGVLKPRSGFSAPGTPKTARLVDKAA